MDGLYRKAGNQIEFSFQKKRKRINEGKKKNEAVFRRVRKRIEIILIC